jgi:hypothetical protein
VIGKGNKLAVLFSFILASSALLGELAHNHSNEIHDAEHHEIKLHNECLTCTSDQVSDQVELASYHLFFSDNIEIEHINSYQKKNQSYFLSRAPPQ